MHQADHAAADTFVARWRRLLAPRHWAVWTGIGMLRLLVLLPFPIQLACGRALGALLRRLPVRYVRIARTNIDMCLAELPPGERRRLLDRHFDSLGISIVEIALAWWGRGVRILELARIEGCEHVAAALARGRGAILLTAHFTPLEIGGRILSERFPVNILYRPAKNEVLACLQERLRSRNGGRAIRCDDIQRMIAALRNNECVWFAPDQCYRKKGAEMVPLFGVPAATNTATSRIARMTGAAVLPYFVERLAGSRGYRLRILPPLQDFPSDSPAADAAQFHRLIEAQVRAVPEQYLWIHRRFKGLSPGYPDYYRSRRSTPAVATSAATIPASPPSGRRRTKPASISR